MERFCWNQIKSITSAGCPNGLEKLEKLENRVFSEKKQENYMDVDSERLEKHEQINDSSYHYY